MPIGAREVEALLDELEGHPADALEGPELDFKVWPTRSLDDAIEQVIEMAVCMANGGGGPVVFGVKDRVKSRARAILGVPLEVDTNRLAKTVYDSTDPKITPVFQDLRVPEGTGRLLVMQVFGGLPPYTDTKGRGKVRVGKDCQGLTGTMRRRIMVETGETDYTAESVEGTPAALLSASALEQLRDVARAERAPEDLLTRTDLDLLGALDLMRGGRVTRAGVFIAGTEDAIRRHLPGYVWTYLRMRSDTEYADRGDGHHALPVALLRLTDRIMTDNPISTLDQGLFHYEYRAYPEIALREALMNALCHTDFRLSGPVLVKHFPDRLEISNLGGFIGGVSAENILHHPPAARNPLLVAALTRLRLVNRSNLGVGRMFTAFLVEGKAPPTIIEQGDAVTVAFRRQDISAPFRLFVAEESKAGHSLGLDQLLVLHHLLSHPELETAGAARLCQRSEPDARELLNDLQARLGYLERGGTGRGMYWTLRPDLHRRLAGVGHPERDRRIDWEAAKLRVHSVLVQRRRRGEPGMTNAEVRKLTYLDRQQVNRLVHELEDEGLVAITGYARGARYEASGPDRPSGNVRPRRT